MNFLLDANVCVDYLNGTFPSVVSRLQQCSPSDLGTSSVVAAELRYGAERSQRKKANHARLDVFLDELAVVDFGVEAARIYGQVGARLEARGQVIGPNDMMIASHALALGLVLVTDNVREFRGVRSLRVENWRD